MMYRTALLACLALAGAPSLGCGGEPGVASASFPAEALTTLTTQGGALQVEVRTAPDQPPGRGVIAVEYRVVGSNGMPAPGLTLGVVPWMPDMGHGASVVPSVADMGGGRYVVSDVEVFMPGKWELRTTFAGAIQDSATPVLQIP
jgi:hypothetical protein